jgi:uncharacterized protein (UPF0548 family)
MKVHIPFPSEQTLKAFLHQQAKAAFTYDEVGQSAAAFPEGYDHDSRRIQLGKGVEDYERAKKCLVEWKMFPPGWVSIYPAVPLLEKGQEVVVVFKIFGIWWLNACRIVYHIDEARRYGFAYGTLAGHVEKGEERFEVYMDKDENVWYQVAAFSMPNLWLVKLAYPLARRFQKKFVKDSFISMQKAMQHAS